MGEIVLFQPIVTSAVQNSAKKREVPAEDEKLLYRMRRIWRRCEDMLGDIDIVRKDTDPEIADRTFHSWWSRQHRISWSGGKLIERAMAHRLSETRAATLEIEADMRKSAQEFSQTPRLVPS